jgi:hypothetical protein
MDTAIVAPVSYWAHKTADQANRPRAEVIQVFGMGILNTPLVGPDPIVVVHYGLVDDNSSGCYSELNLFESLYYQIA